MHSRYDFIESVYRAKYISLRLNKRGDCHKSNQIGLSDSLLNLSLVYIQQQFDCITFAYNYFKLFIKNYQSETQSNDYSVEPNTTPCKTVHKKCQKIE